MMKIFLHISPLLLLLLFQEVSAQRYLNKYGTLTPWEIGLSAGVSSFVTSINPDGAVTGRQINYWYREANPGIGLSVVRNISPALGIEINWLNTKLTGRWNDNFPPLSIYSGHESPFPFKSQINQFDLMAAFNLNQIILPDAKKDLWHIFLKPGIGMTNIKNFDKYSPGNTYTTTRMSLALDAGVSVSLNEKIKLIIGNTIRAVNTDNLDGTWVVSSGTFGETRNYMSVFELYNYSYLRVSYRLGEFGSKKTNCTFGNKKRKHRNYKRY